MTPFTTDGCSGGMSWLWRLIFRCAPPWEGLCVEHDRAYWRGGSREMRAIADEKLLVAVKELGYERCATFMWIGVRIGGHPLLPFPWRWGYGHPYPKGY